VSATPVLLTLLAIALPLCGWAAQPFTPPVVSVPAVTAGPVVDGRVEPAEWAQAAVLSDFVTLGANALPSLPTKVFLQYDASNFYLGAICYDPHPEALQALAVQRDGPVTADDCLQLFVDTVGQRTSVAHLAVNAAGTQFDAFAGDISQDFKWTVACAQQAEGWSIELALPFARGIGPEVGDTWLLNVGRYGPGPDESSCWAPAQDSFDELDRLGTLIFSGPPFRVAMQRLGELWLGANLAQFEVQSLIPTTEPVPVKLNVRVMGENRADHYFHAEKLTVGTEATLCAIPFHVSSDGPSTIVFSLTDGQGLVAWRSAAYAIEIPPVRKAMRELEADLSDTLKAWSRLSAGEQKTESGEDLTEVLSAWRALDQRLQQREAMSAEQYANLLTEVNLLQRAAQALAVQVSSAGE